MIRVAIPSRSKHKPILTPRQPPFRSEIAKGMKLDIYDATEKETVNLTYNINSYGGKDVPYLKNADGGRKA